VTSTRRTRLFRAQLPAARGVVRCALIVRLLDEWWSYLPAGTIDDQRLDLGLSYTQAGWLLALLTVGGLVGSPVAALADRGHRRLLATGGACLLALGLSAFAAGAPFAVLALAATLLGAASDIVITPLESSLAETADGDLDRLLGRQHLITWLGDFIGPALLALGAATAIGWRGVFAITAAVFAGFAVVLAGTDFPPPRHAPAADGEGSTRSAWALARHPDVLKLSAAEFVLLPLDEAFLGFAVARLAAEGVGGAAQVLAGGIVVGGIAGSALVSRRGIDDSAVMFGAATIIAGAGGAALPVATALQVAAMALLGFGTAITWARVHHRQLTVIPGRSATVSTMVGVLSTPALLVPIAMGVVADRFSITVTLLGAAALTLPLAAIVTTVGREPPPTTRPTV
jgi:MFS family permease